MSLNVSSSSYTRTRPNVEEVVKGETPRGRMYGLNSWGAQGERNGEFNNPITPLIDRIKIRGFPSQRICIYS